jgi:hypothetical protein
VTVRDAPQLLGLDGPGVWVPAATAARSLRPLRAFERELAREGLSMPPDLRVFTDQCQLAWEAIRPGPDGSGGSASAVPLVDVVPEPAALSADDDVEWVRTGVAAVAANLSASYLRRVARGQHEASRVTAGGRYEWNLALLLELRSA